MSVGTDNLSPLSALTPGDRAKIVAVDVPGEMKGRILEMGFTVGATVEVIGFAPLGDPMEVKVRGSRVSLRKAEAASLRVERL